MLKKKRPRRLTDEQREWIMSQPGVVVHERTEPPTDPFYVPKIRARTPLKLTASDLINDDDEDQVEPS